MSPRHLLWTLACFFSLCSYAWPNGGPRPVRYRSPASSASLIPHASASEDWVWVVKSDGAKSCQPRSGIPLAAMTQELGKNGIPFKEKQKFPSEKAHIQMCGTPKGSFNGALIPISVLPKAEALGFQMRSPH